MTPVLSQALYSITNRTNANTDSMLPSGWAITKEMLILLRVAGETLPSHEIETWVRRNGWSRKDAKSLGALVKMVNAGRLKTLRTGRWWPEDVVMQFLPKQAS